MVNARDHSALLTKLVLSTILSTTVGAVGLLGWLEATPSLGHEGLEFSGGSVRGLVGWGLGWLGWVSLFGWGGLGQWAVGWALPVEKGWVAVVGLVGFHRSCWLVGLVGVVAGGLGGVGWVGCVKAVGLVGFNGCCCQLVGWLG